MQSKTPFKGPEFPIEPIKERRLRPDKPWPPPPSPSPQPEKPAQPQPEKPAPKAPSEPQKP